MTGTNRLLPVVKRIELTLSLSEPTVKHVYILLMIENL